MHKREKEVRGKWGLYSTAWAVNLGNNKVELVGIGHSFTATVYQAQETAGEYIIFSNLTEMQTEWNWHLQPVLFGMGFLWIQQLLYYAIQFASLWSLDSRFQKLPFQLLT